MAIRGSPLGGGPGVGVVVAYAAVEFISDRPKNAYGKVLRRELKARYRDS